MRQKNSVPLQIEKGLENSLPHVEEVTEEHKKAVESVQRHSLRLLYFYKIKIRTAGHQHFPLPTVLREGTEPEQQMLLWERLPEQAGQQAVHQL